MNSASSCKLWRFVSALLFFAASVGLTEIAQAAPQEIAPIANSLAQARERLSLRRAGEERARSALTRAQRAESLAIELKDDAALPIAREAIAIARRAILAAQEGIEIDEQTVSKLLADGQRICADWLVQEDVDRRAIDRLSRTMDLTQNELREWSKMNADAQQEALLAVAKAFIGEYVADIDKVRNKVKTLHAAARVLNENVASATTKARRLKELRRLEKAMSALSGSKTELFSKEWAKGVTDVDKMWKIVRDTWHHEFRVAKNHNESLREVLNDPAFKEVFTGSDENSPGMEVLRTLTSEAAVEAGKFALGVEKYQVWAGPYVRAADFTIKMTYAASKSLVSMVRVFDANSVAGEEVRAAKALQLQYQKSVDSVRECRLAGFAQRG